MRWIKHGNIFAPSGQGQLKTHAQMPCALIVGDQLRIYFSSRPRPGQSVPTFIEVALADPTQVSYIHDRALFEPGPPGAFDEHGIMPAMVMRRGNTVMMYYTGWSRLGGAAPYNNSSGLAVSEDGGLSFTRAFAGPVLTRSAREPYSCLITWVLVDEEGVWHAWYSASVDWVEINGRWEDLYLIHHATSDDGIDWHHREGPIVPVTGPNEAQTRPTVRWSDGLWHMWFCYRSTRDFRDGGGAYRIGYAWSKDLSTWCRDDAACGLDVSPEGWDSKMVCYPCVTESTSGALLLYSGNGFGQGGLGFARLEQ